MANIYLQHEFSTGNIYEYSKEEKEGFEKHTSTKGKVTNRRYYKKGLYGILKGISVRDSNFGREISIAMTDKFKNTVYFNLALYDQKDNITDYAQSLIRVIKEMKVGYAYRIYPYVMEREGTDYKNYGISVKHADIEEETVRDDYPLPLVSKAYYKKEGDKQVLVEGDIPAEVWEKKAGKNKKNCDARDEYLFELLTSVAKDTTSEAKKEPIEKGEPPVPATMPSAPSVNAEPPAPAKAPEPTMAYKQEEPSKEEPTPAEAPAPSAGTTEKGDKVELPF